MKDFSTKKSVVLIEDVKVDGKDIFLNMATANLIRTVGFANKVNMDNPEEIDEIARMLFTEESYNLVSLLDFDDFMTILDLASVILDKQEKSVTERFKRAE